MDQETRLAAAQLRRMRGMTRYYHSRFFNDIRFSVVASAALLVIGWWEVPEAFLLVPVVALLGATSSAFDASYLIFARHYAARLEEFLNAASGRRVLVAGELEAEYLFPLDVPKVVTAAFGRYFTWFGFMTLFFTGVGAAVFGFGLALALPVLDAHDGAWRIAYLITLGVAVASALGVGAWWFVGGAGERRLKTVLDRSFPGPVSR